MRRFPISPLWTVVAVLSLVASLTVSSSAQASDPGIRELQGNSKRAFFKDAGFTGALRCFSVGVSRSNARWAIAAPSGKCGPNSGHSYVYKQQRTGKWKFLFYDMENDGCDRFRMPAGVRKDFRYYVC